MEIPLGLYLSVPFCRAKCTFCNFASDVFAPARLGTYVERLCNELRNARAMAETMGAHLPHCIDTVYFGGGTPSLLEPGHLRSIFATIREQFFIASDAEITLEAAPGQIAEDTLQAALAFGVNRISFGVQSFIHLESSSVGRTHTAAECLAEITRMRRAGIERVSLDLIAGLPHQTAESWASSVEQAVQSSVDHVSIYMLEIDEDSRLGRAALTFEDRYHAAALPSDDEAAEWYQAACTRLEHSGLDQYEISNFARPGFASRHNLKYWHRSPYLGVGLDAHSMLSGPACTAVRWANSSDLDEYLLSGTPPQALQLLHRKNPSPEADHIGPEEAFEEELFLGLRLNVGVDLHRLESVYGHAPIGRVREALADAESAGLLEFTEARIRLTPRGRLASNEVFSRLLVA